MPTFVRNKAYPDGFLNDLDEFPPLNHILHFVLVLHTKQALLHPWLADTWCAKLQVSEQILDKMC